MASSKSHPSLALNVHSASHASSESHAAPSRVTTMQEQSLDSLPTAPPLCAEFSCSMDKAKLDLGQKKIRLRIKFKGYRIQREMTRFCIIFALILIAFSIATIILTITAFAIKGEHEFAPRWAIATGVLSLGSSMLAIFLIRVVEVKGSFASCFSFLFFSYLSWQFALLSTKNVAEWLFLLYSCVPTMLLFLIAFIFGSKGFVLAANKLTPVKIEKKEKKLDE